MGANIWGPEIIIADQDGANPITLQNEHAPYPIPQPQAEYEVELYPMRSGGPGQPGLRVAQLGGASEDSQDIELSVKFVNAEQFESFWAKYYRQPAEPIAYTLDGGGAWCLAVFQRTGFVPSNWEEDWEKQSVVVRLHKLGSVTFD